MAIISYGYSHNVLLLLQPISRIFLSSRQREDEEAVDLCYYHTCVIWHMYKIILAPFLLTENVVMSKVMR